MLGGYLDQKGNENGNGPLTRIVAKALSIGYPNLPRYFFSLPIIRLI